jgi:manganese/zinc/iron transport system permease protein
MILSVILGVLSAILGYYLAVAVQGSIAGAMATVVGIEFAVAFLFAPKTGLIYKYISKQKPEFVSQ